MTRFARDAGWTSDVRRGRLLAGLFVGTLAGALLVAATGAVVGRASQRRYDPSPPHLEAAVSCEACHGTTASTAEPSGGVSSDVCVRCHGPHPSTRAAHRARQVSGELRCGTCHAIHASDEAAVFSSTAPPRRFRGTVSASVPDRGFRPERRAIVPLVPRDACLSCHDLDRQSDRAARCFEPGSTTDGCFDEHRGALAEDARRTGVCAGQHDAARAFAWEAARDVARSGPAPGFGVAAGGWGLATALLGGVGGVLGLIVARRRGNRGGNGGAASEQGKPRPNEPRPLVPARRVRLPRIDESRCLGCFACVDACPYDVLAIEGYVAKVVREEACCGVVLCQQRCPNGSLVIAEGEVRPDLPPLTDALESELVPGVFLAGDVTGGSLIKNAIHQATACVDALAEASVVATQKRLGRGHWDADVIVVGAGPAGIAAALRAKERGLRCVVLERGSLAESIRSFPRGKLVFDQPLEVPVVGKLWLEESTKEELLAQWTRVARKERLDVREGRTVVALQQRGEGAGFDVVIDRSDGETVALEQTHERLSARHVVLCVGRRGTARKLPIELPDEAVSRVFYHLADARSFEGRRVVVVGLGDVAMEAALALSEQAGTHVTVVHRGLGFSRGSARNGTALQARAADGRLDLRLGTAVRAVGADHVVLAAVDAPADTPGERLAVDAVFVLIGTEPPRALLERLGVLLPDPSRATSV